MAVRRRVNGLGDILADRKTARMAATQRPPTLEALTEPSGDRPPWRELPSWFLIGEQDHTIPAALQRFRAERACRAVRLTAARERQAAHRASPGFRDRR